MIALMRQILRKMRVPLYFHKKSNHIFTVHQHVIMLILRQYESKSYESFVEWLEVATDVTQMLGIKTIPHFTTLQKAAARLSEAMLHVAIGRFIGLVCPGRVFGGADASGFEEAMPPHTTRIVPRLRVRTQSCSQAPTWQHSWS